MQKGETLVGSWEKITTALFGDSDILQIQTAELQHAVDVLCDHQMASVITEWFLQTLQHKMTSELHPKFWRHFSSPVTDVVSQLSAAFDELLSEVDKYWASVQRLGVLQNYIASNITDMPCTSALPYVDPNKHIMLLLKSVVFYQANKHFIQTLNQFYVLSFKAYDNNTKSNTDLDESEVECLRCEGCDEEREQCRCEVILTTFYHLNQRLRELGLLECVSGEAVTSHIHARIKQHVEHTCQGNFEKQYLSILQEWLDSKVVGWLGLVYGTTDPTIVQAHRGRLTHYMYQLFAKLCIHQLFDVIIEYPESEPALLDLKACLEKINLRGMLVSSLRSALETRLLHPGVNTGDILTAYISAIRALRVLDPKGVLLDLVCQPVRTYLRHREDTVRCIVSSLTEDGNTELSDELVKAQPLVLDESYHSDDDTSDWETWQPDPVDADPLKSSSRRSSDIISMLVNIYGSKELFVTEYQTLLADRILTHFNYDTEKEIRYLELLKLRFGETQLHSCEVMLKDVADSRRLNSNMAEKKEKESKESNDQPAAEEGVSVSGMVLSAQFWPSFREERLELPPELQTALDGYTKAFEALKGNRTLCWKPHLGVMDIELELKDRIVNMKVSPSHAAIIWHFQQKQRWTVEELTGVMKMPTHALRRKMAFWQSHGLLREESADVFVLVEEQRGRHHDNTMVVEEDEAESAMASAEDVKEEEYQVFWQYIQAMLTNLDSLGLERIHSMLQMFAMQKPGSKITLQELKAFLDRKVKDQKLVLVSGVYRLAQS